MLGALPPLSDLDIPIAPIPGVEIESFMCAPYLCIIAASPPIADLVDILEDVIACTAL